MKVKLYGVRLQVAKGLTAGDLFDHIEHLDGFEARFDGRLRIFHIDSSRGCRLLLILSVKDQKRFMAMRRQGRKFEVTPYDFEQGTEIVDFNILTVDEKSGKGLYQYYKGSLGIQGLQTLLGQLHANMVATKRLEWVEAQDGGDK